MGCDKPQGEDIGMSEIEEVILSDAQVRDMAHAGTLYVEMTDERYVVTGRFRVTDTCIYEDGSYDLHLETDRSVNASPD